MAAYRFDDDDDIIEYTDDDDEEFEYIDEEGGAREEAAYGYTYFPEPQCCCPCHQPAPPSRKKRIRELQRRIARFRANPTGKRIFQVCADRAEEELSELLWETWLESRGVVYLRIPKR